MPTATFSGRNIRLLLHVCALIGINSAARSNDPTTTANHLEFFEKQVRPLFVEHCYQCHSVEAKKLQAGLLMDSRQGLLTGGDSGPAIVPHETEKSLLIDAVRYESYEMPPKGKLPQEQIAVLEKWVELGAPWPEETPPTAKATGDSFDIARRKSEHWVWQPLAQAPSPNVVLTTWPRNNIDLFLLHRLEQAGLHPAPDAERSALVRRLYFDLIGLPPTPEQVQQVLSNPSESAMEQLVDELLDSPHFGERWGRHWLDLVRYAESRGHEFDNDARNAFQYRDYIIRAFNADVPYDQLIREHLAGDLLPQPRLHPTEKFNESILGTGFWFLGEWVHSPVDIRKDETDRFDNMIDVMSKTFLGVTVACARCHDHKFDAISTEDYYALAGFLQSSDYRQASFESLEHNRAVAQELDRLDRQFQDKIRDLTTKLVSENSGASLPELSRSTLADDPEFQAARVLDFASIQPAEFMQDGFIFGAGPRFAGTPYLTEQEGKTNLQFARRHAAVADPFWHGLKAVHEKGVHNRSRLDTIPQSSRTLRTPTFTLTDGSLDCRIRGSGQIVACVDSHRLIAGPLHGETVSVIKPEQTWVRMNLKRYVGHRVHLEFTPDPDSPLEVSLVLQGASPNLRKKIEQEESVLETAVDQWAQALDETRTKSGEAAKEQDALVQQWAQQRAELRKQVRLESRTAMAMMDGTGEDETVLIRGNSSNPGKPAPRRFLTAISGAEPLAMHTRSGRLELADQINAPENPLTSRVIVNRVWHYLMGRGIVPTTDDFGVLGQRPSHPELLDYLASQFLQNGRSIKKMIREIVLSRSYQMSSQADPACVAADPSNTLWHHRTPKRLEGEAIRDALLSISGRLKLQMFGEPVPIHLTSFMNGRGRPGQSGPLDGEGRRSIYIAVRRNFLSPFMMAFDAPTPFSTMGRRNVSNVPAQALILLNDPLVVDLAKSWAQRAIQHVPLSADGDPVARIQWMYATAFARSPTTDEHKIAVEYLRQQAEAQKTDLAKVEIWTDFAHALINTKEFIFLR